jgi:gentisate 1,2-dioxygenase
MIVSGASIGLSYREYLKLTASCKYVCCQKRQQAVKYIREDFVARASADRIVSNELQAQREQFYEQLHGQSIEPLWRVLGDAAPAEPRVQSLAHMWAWRDVRPCMMKASDLVTPREAERRVLMLINPAFKSTTFRTVGLIYAGIQLIMPGEVADSHRHTPNAQRFIIEGEGAYTAVEGERTIMSKGDFVLTPGWTWHDHGNESGKPMIWLDGLDLPFAIVSDANFFEDYAGGDGQMQPIYRQAGDSHHRWGRNLRPTWAEPSSTSSTPILNYRWTESRDALHGLRAENGSPYDGVILQYTNPVTGGPTLPTISACLQLLRKGERTQSHRHTSSTVYHVAEGEGRSLIGDAEYRWEEGDTFVVPSWAAHAHESVNGEAVLFSYSDRPIIDAFGYYREAPLPQE